jgi:hypothetical protein
MKRISRAIGAAKLALHANSPTLLVVGGVLAMGAAAVLACRATVKLEETLAPTVVELERIENNRKNAPQIKGGGAYGDEHAFNDRVVAYKAVAPELAKIYGLPVAMFFLGAAMAFKGNRIMQQRNAALAMAFTTLKKSFDTYRSRVVAEEGHEADQRYLNGSKNEMTTSNGVTRQTESRNWQESLGDPYNRVFSNETSDQWQNDLGANKLFVANQQRFAQQLLNRQGYIYLSDVYKALGIAESDTSRVCGWHITYTPDGTRNVPIVDFGIDKPIDDAWKYNQHKAIFLEFNCQGLIIGGKVQKIIEAAVA